MRRILRLDLFGLAGYRQPMPAIPCAARGSASARGIAPHIRAFLPALILSALVASCSPSSRGSGSAMLWTDTPELALAVELFNASREDQLVELEYKEDLALALAEKDANPSFAIGSYLKSRKVRGKFQSLDYLFGELYLNQTSFYPKLLALGKTEGRQILLPVSFNLPAIVFAKGKYRPPDPLFMELGAMGQDARSFNRIENGEYARMGFSPRWNSDFLLLYAQSLGAGFREEGKFAWSADGLSRVARELRAWSREKNTSDLSERSFDFKYLFTPDYQYIAQGRALFAYMDSSRLFSLPEEKRSPLDFRWFSESGATPVDDDIVFAGILRAGRNKTTAETFLKWFFKEANQNMILERARSTGGLDMSFGLAGGFSSVRSVDERIFPRFYPSLLGRMPLPERLSTPPALPQDWPAIKQNVVVPWLLETLSRNEESIDPARDFAARLDEYRQNATVTSVR